MSHQKLRLNSRMAAVQTPLIPTIGELIRQNPGTISLGQGVVSYPPPPNAISSITEFLASPVNHKYQAVVGIPPLIEAIKTKLQAENKIAINQDNSIVVTAGSNMAFLNIILAITSPGDEIILNTPYYFNHEMAITMASCQPVLVATDANYQLRLDAIAEAITNKTKAIVTISPNNPTGGAFYFLLKIKTEIPDIDLVKKLIENYQVAVLPGSTFGMINGCYLRVAYGALEPETAVVAIARLVRGLREMTTK